MQAHLIKTAAGGSTFPAARPVLQRIKVYQEQVGIETRWCAKYAHNGSISSLCFPKRCVTFNQDKFCEGCNSIRHSFVGSEGLRYVGGRTSHPCQAVAEAGPAQTSSEEEASTSESGSNDGLYKPFVEYAVKALGKQMELWPYPIKEEFIRLEATDSKGQKAVTDSTYLQSHKLRQMRACNIQAGNNLQVLNLIAFPRPEYDLPYFCADLVTLPRGHLQILDLNPLHRTREHFEKHIKPLLPIANRYIKVLPWGGEFTAESLQFFSPALLWTRPSDRTTVQTVIFEAFKEYIDAYAEMVAKAVPTTDPVEIARNREAQHKYVCWRAEKDPGRPVITKLYGTELCEAYIHGFLFDGMKELGSKTFLDYFPEYRGPDGNVIKKRSVVGKKCVTRPWDLDGNFIPPT